MLCQGFGRKIKVCESHAYHTTYTNFKFFLLNYTQTSTTSLDMPDFFKDPNVKHKHHLADLQRSYTRISQTYSSGPTASLYVLPGLQHLQEVKENYMKTTGQNRVNFKFYGTNDGRPVSRQISLQTHIHRHC